MRNMDGIFKSFLRVLYCTSNLFCPSTICLSLLSRAIFIQQLKCVKYIEFPKSLFKKSLFPSFFLSLSLCPIVWPAMGIEFYKFLIFLIRFNRFLHILINAAGQQVDQKYTATVSDKILIQAKLTILGLKMMYPHLHHERGQKVLHESYVKVTLQNRYICIYIYIYILYIYIYIEREIYIYRDIHIYTYIYMHNIYNNIYIYRNIY